MEVQARVQREVLEVLERDMEVMVGRKTTVETTVVPREVAEEESAGLEKTPT
jgi:hypothetical protein